MESCSWAIKIGPTWHSGSVGTIVDIEASDVAFRSEYCGTWEPYAPIVSPGEPFGAGSFIVGEEIEPGRYRAVGPPESCYWAPLHDFRPQPLGEIGVTVVDIESSYVGFYSHGCGTWSRDLAKDTEPVRDFSDGTHLIGIDIEPGTYRARTYSDDCEWLRLSGFRGFGQDVITRSRMPVVHIDAADTGFRSRGCGEWRPWTPTSFEEGDHRVGIDVLPGRYRAIGASEECTWGTGAVPKYEYKKGDEVPLLMLPLTVVDIDPADERFISQGCGSWSEDLAPVAEAGEPFGDGTYIVGLDIASGRYRAVAPSDSCFWLRLADFRIFGGKHGLPDFRTTVGGWWPTVLGGETSTIVDIEPSDVGFYSSGCGTWSDDLTPIVEPGEPFPDGTYVVGDELAPGRYRATAPSDSCHWARLNDFLGEYGHTHQGFVIRRSGPTSIVDIAPEDAGFWSIGCGTWTGDLSPVATPGQAFPDGTYIVGVDIEPGRYRATVSDEVCEWRRLYDFGGPRGAYEGFYATSWGQGLPIVDIYPSDVGFTSSGCGTWSNSLTPILTSGELFGDGTYLVGIDIDPGRYRAPTASWGCHWWRLSGFFGFVSFEGYFPDIIAHGGEDATTVDIQPSDAGFRTQRCGEWHPVASDEE